MLREISYLLIVNIMFKVKGARPTPLGVVANPNFDFDIKRIKAN